MNNQASQDTTLDETYSPCVFEEVLDIASAAALHGQLVEALCSGQPVSLAADRVERIDTAALQVICAFVQEARSRNHVWQWQQPSEALRQTAALLGLSEVLALDTH